MTMTHKLTHVLDARSRLLEQYKRNAGVLALIDALANQSQDLEDSAWTLQTMRTLSASVGVQLDGIGSLVGLDRGGRVDAIYRLWLASKILSNSSKGDAESIIAIGRAMINDTWQLQDLWPASFIVTAPESLPYPGDAARILGAGISAGVRGQLIYTTTDFAETFSFSDDDTENNGAVSTSYITAGTYDVVIPANATSVRVQLWGGGGSGGQGHAPAGKGGSGGGGGAYAESTIASPVAGHYALVVGAGGVSGDGSASSWAASIVLAAPGKAGNRFVAPFGDAGGVGGLSADSIGDTKYSGGSGGVMSTSDGTGGGGSAGTAAAGNTVIPGTRTGASAVSGGGPGGDGAIGGIGATPWIGHAPVSSPGGGGGGGGVDTTHEGVGGPGYAGKAIVTITPAINGWADDAQTTGGLWADVEQL